MAAPEAPVEAVAATTAKYAVQAGPQVVAEGSLPPEDVHPSLEALRRYISEWAKARGYAFIKRRSTNNSSSGGRLVITFACDRSGRPHQSIAVKRQRKPTRRCNCSYSFMARENADGTWSIRHRSQAKFSQHNHEPSIDPSEHPASRSLFSSEKSLVLDMAAVGITPRQILAFLQRRKSLATRRDIYNCISAEKRKAARDAGRSREAVNTPGDLLDEGMPMSAGVLSDNEAPTPPETTGGEPAESLSVVPAP